MLDLRHLALALNAVDLTGGERRVEVGVLGVGLERPPPPGIAIDIDGGAKIDARAFTGLLGADDLSVAAGKRWIEGGGERNPGGQRGHPG